MSEQKENTEEKDQKPKAGGGRKNPLPKNTNIIYINMLHYIFALRAMVMIPQSGREYSRFHVKPQRCCDATLRFYCSFHVKLICRCKNG